MAIAATNKQVLETIFAEWDRRAAEGAWDGNKRSPEASAAVFNEIALAQFPGGLILRFLPAED